MSTPSIKASIRWRAAAAWYRFRNPILTSSGKRWLREPMPESVRSECEALADLEPLLAELVDAPVPTHVIPSVSRAGNAYFRIRHALPSDRYDTIAFGRRAWFEEARKQWDGRSLLIRPVGDPCRSNLRHADTIDLERFCSGFSETERDIMIVRLVIQLRAKHLRFEHHGDDSLRLQAYPAIKVLISKGID